MRHYSQRRIKGLLSRLFARMQWEVEGLEHIPLKGPAIIIMNHTGWEEILITILASPRDVRITGMRELMYLDDPLSRSRIFDTTYASDFGILRRSLTSLLGQLLGRFVRYRLREFGFIPVRVFTEGRPPTLGGNGIRETLQVLRNGDLMVMFPEGGYKRDGVMRPFKPGLGMILRMMSRQGLRVPVIPAAQHTANSITATLTNRFVPRIVFDAPVIIRCDDQRSRPQDEFIVRELQNRVSMVLARAWPDHPPQTYSDRIQDNHSFTHVRDERTGITEQKGSRKKENSVDCIP